jgi:hypothetical protein
MRRKSKWDYLKAIYQRYRQAPKIIRQQIIDTHTFTGVVLLKIQAALVPRLPLPASGRSAG